ncbi:YdaS family helix-turn-helix protein [Yersinia enterocolitica]|uniref:transcriptional regulator n=1 Tax=Yersinia kristensenii TaxID=28152 RepID=UPI001C60AC0A|nr:YdaS family helix-turn-helix protein [Yersinia kristensenii]MBW5814387.1 helix-turn-helix domain-containing protein [Yersinia kristensenii]
MIALQRAIAAVGGTKEFAKQLGITQQSISRWKNKYKGIVPSSRVIQIFNITGVTPHDLRPDLYPNPTDGLPVDQQILVRSK